MNKLNVEGEELALKNKNGDVAIIPKNQAAYVEALIKAGQHDKIDDFVSMLPAMSKKAADGTVIPEELLTEFTDQTDPKKKKDKNKAERNARLEKEHEGIGHRTSFLDLISQNIPAHEIELRKRITDERTFDGKLGEHQKNYNNVIERQNKWNSDFEKKLLDYAPGGNFVMDHNDMASKNYDPERDKISYFASLTPKERSQAVEMREFSSDPETANKQKAYRNYFEQNYNKFYDEKSKQEELFYQDKNSNIKYSHPDTNFQELISRRTDITDKDLLAVSLMAEGADEFVHTFPNRSDFGLAYDGFHYFGLDTIGERVDEFIQKGYLDKDFKNRMEERGAYNEKEEFMRGGAFGSLDDVISAKEAFLKASKVSITKQAKSLGIELSPTAMDYFTLVGYNAGEGNAIKMLQTYNKHGILKDDRFMDDDSYGGYRVPHEFAKKRMIAMMMFRNEGVFEKQTKTPNKPPKINIPNPIKL